MSTKVVNLRRDPYDVYIGRAGHGMSGYFGNPFVLGPRIPRAKQMGVLESYRGWFLHRVETNKEFRARVLALRGKRLGCFCKPGWCHGDVMAEWIDAQPDDGIAKPQWQPRTPMGGLS
jgi:Domain of unknown function (DUF4326)